MDNQLIKLENISDIKNLTFNSYQENSDSVEKCLAYGKALYTDVSQGHMDDSKDEKIKKFIDRVVLTQKAINERRKPVTQMFDKVKKVFTDMENSISIKNAEGVIYMLQKLRNDYAAAKLKAAEEERQRQQREQLLLVSKNNLHAEAIERLHAAVNKALDENIGCLNSLFSDVTLDTIDDVKNTIFNYLETFNIGNYWEKPFPPQNIDEETYKQICKSAYLEVKDSINEQYKSEIVSLKDDLLLKLPSKKIELEKIEEQKKTDADAAKKAAEELARKDADVAAKKEAERKAEEDKRKQAEALSSNKKSMDDLFNQTAVAPVTSAKVTKKIEVIDVKGFLNIIQLWWVGEGVNMSIEDLSKKLKFAVSFAEKQANKSDDNLIVSPYIKYVDDVKAK